MEQKKNKYRRKENIHGGSKDLAENSKVPINYFNNLSEHSTKIKSVQWWSPLIEACNIVVTSVMLFVTFQIFLFILCAYIF
jgi:hypothetical protein